MKKEYQVRKALTRGNLARGGTTLVGVTVAQALDEIIEKVRGDGGGQIDPLSIEIETSKVAVLGQPSLGVEVRCSTRNMVEQ